MPKKGKPLSTVRATSVFVKRFNRVVPTPPRVRLPLHPAAVLIDLRNGSLSSLDAYLKKHRGIPDREVALELSNLLSGSATRTRFRLVVVDHPDGPPSKGGRPKSHGPTPEQLARYAVYRTQFDFFDKKEIAIEETAKRLELSTKTIDRAIDAVEAPEREEEQRREAKDRSRTALENLKKSTQPDT